MSQKNSLGDAAARQKQLHQLLESSLTTESTCTAYLPQLAAYIDAQLAGEDYLANYADVAVHLDSCLTCADTYARLYELEVALAAATLPEPGEIPAPDLSFLHVSASQSPLSLIDLLADAITTTADKMHLQLATSLLALMQPLQAAPLTRDAADNARYQQKLYELKPEQLPETTIPIKLIVYRDEERPAQCLLEVTVMPPGESWPNLGGRTVTLQVDQERLAAVTDAWGVAAFADIPLERLDGIELAIALTK